MQSISLRQTSLFLSVVSVILLLVACGPSAPQAVPTPESVPATVASLATAAVVPTAPPVSEESAYPPPAAVDEVAQPYPGGAEAALPPQGYPPVSEETFLEPRFQFDAPVTAAATTVTGQAPPNTPLAIMDVTYNGELLGLGQSDANGRFTIPVSGLVAGNRIGIGIGDITTGQSIEALAEQYFPHRGEGFMNLPNVGIFYDTALVEP
ncbi:MAG: hypothetical protein LC131_01220 [Anaerolineae bacterium]|nr:hypothetical protein [Anaerolineae bacterium]